MGFRFLHAADLHVASPFRGMTALPELIRERVRESTFRALDTLVDTALRERVDFVVVSGDVYDAADRSLRAQLRLQSALRRLAAAGVPSFVAHGNHDPADGRAARLEWPESVHFFAADRVESVPVVLPERGLVAEVHGQSFASAAVRDNLALGFRACRRTPGVFQLAVLHANVDGDERHDNYAPCSLRDLVESGFDYWALGHIHTRRIVHERPWVVYPGNTQGRSVRECGPRVCCIVDVDDDGGVDLNFHELDDVRWAVERIDIASLETEQELIGELYLTIERVRAEAGGRAAIVRVVLGGRGPLYRSLHGHARSGGGTLEELAAVLREEAGAAASAGSEDWVWIESMDDEMQPAIDAEELLVQQSFLGELLRQGRELLNDPANLTSFAAETVAPLLDGAGRRLARDWLADRQTELLSRAETRIIDALAIAEGDDT
jgi:DNA repair exonuclease SbcCD nuclease subunit